MPGETELINNLEIKEEQISTQSYNIIILVGKNLNDIPKITEHLKKKEIESGGKFQGAVFGDGDKTTVNQLLESYAVKTALRNSNEKTLVIINTHGGYGLKNNSRTNLRLDGNTNVLEIVPKIHDIKPDIKYLKFVACYVGTNSRANLKDEAVREAYKLITKDVVIFESGDSKYSTVQVHNIDRILESIDLTFEGVIQQSSLINEREMIISALRDPLSMYISNHGESHKFSRLFRDIEKDSNGNYKVGYIDEEMINFISQISVELKEAFPEHEELIKKLVREEVYNGLVDILKNKALNMYIARGTTSVVKALVDSGIDINSQDKYGLTPLTQACFDKKLDIIELLLANEKIDPNLPDKFGNIALSWAVENNHLEIVKLLLANEKTNPNILDQEQNSSLLLAVLSFIPDMVDAVLTNKKTNPDIKDKYGSTALDIALENNQYDVAILIALKSQNYALIKDIMSKDGYDSSMDDKVKSDIIPLQNFLQSDLKDSEELFNKLCDELRAKKGYDKVSKKVVNVESKTETGKEKTEIAIETSKSKTSITSDFPSASPETLDKNIAESLIASVLEVKR